MRSPNRRGIELAASTVVLLVVAVAILGLAVSLTWRVTCAAEDYRAEVDLQTQQQIERLLTTGGTVVLADNSKTARAFGSAICGSSRTRSATFTLGLRNTEPYPLEYRIAVYDADDAIPSGLRLLGDEANPDGSANYSLARGESRVVPIVLVAPEDADPGTLEYTLTVSRGTSTEVRVLYLIIE